jgi:hypothetical protein
MHYLKCIVNNTTNNNNVLFQIYLYKVIFQEGERKLLAH